jgi:hypothetical protein
MGEINNSEVQPTIDNAGSWILRNINSISMYSKLEFMMLVIIVAQLLYALCAKRSIVTSNKGKYRIIAQSVGKLFEHNDVMSVYSTSIINARNALCHSFNDNDCNKLIDALYSDKNIMIDMLKELNIQSYITLNKELPSNTDALSEAIKLMSGK